MTNMPSSDSYFRDAYQNRLEITDSYLALGDIPDLAGVSVENEKGIIQDVRRLLEQDGGGISNISNLAQSLRQEARDLYQEDRIVAIDGTDAISPLRFVSDTLYAAGIVAVTPRSRHQPRARVTRTRASSYVSTQDFTMTWEDNIRIWGEYLRGGKGTRNVVGKHVPGVRGTRTRGRMVTGERPTVSANRRTCSDTESTLSSDSAGSPQKADCRREGNRIYQRPLGKPATSGNWMCSRTR